MLNAILLGYAQVVGWDITWLQRISIYPLFAHGPIVYSYCLFMTNKQTSSYFWLHFLWLMWPFSWVKLELYQSDFGLNLLHVSSFIQLVGYYVLSLLILRRYSDTIKQNFSNTEKYKLRWLFVLISFLGALLFVDLGLTVIGGLLKNDPAYYQIPHLLVLESLYVFGIGVFAAKQPNIIFDKPLVQSNRKYDRSSLNFQKAQELGETVLALLHNEKLYLENGLSLTQLSERLTIPSHHLSQILSENLKLSFYDLINQLRIEHSKTLLMKKSKAPQGILDIAFESGFNNKSSFNSAFKKYTGLTPTEFRKKNQ